MFLQNKYTKFYFLLIESRKLKSTKSDYYEKHHVIPSSLGGLNDQENIVKLTAREHFIAHWLLTKMVYKKHHIAKMITAFTYFTGNKHRGRILSGKQYEIIKIIRSKHKVYYAHNPESGKIIRLYEFELLPNGFIKGRGKGKPISETHKLAISKANKGRKKTKEEIRKISESNKGKKLSEHHKLVLLNSVKGIKISPETRLKISQSKVGKPRDELTKSKLRDFNLGKHHSEETKALMSQRKMGIPKPKVLCPYCNTSVAINTSKRWHFDNCKMRT